MLRRMAFGLALLFATALMLLVAAFGYAQTRIAKEQISSLIESQLSSATQTATVEELGGLLPFDVRIGRFALADDEGTWLEVNDARLTVKPSALLGGELKVEQVGARRLRIERLPPAEPTAAEAPAGLPKPPELPAQLPVFAVDRLYVEALELGEPVLGQAATFALDGQLATNASGTTVEATLGLRRTDEETARALLRAGADLSAKTFSLDLAASETGGLVGTALGRPDAGAAHVSLTGGGPLSDVRAQLRAEIERLARLDADLLLAWTETPRIELIASLDAQPGALPEAYAQLLGQQARVSVVAAESGPGVYVLDRLSLQIAALAAEGSGRIEVATGTIDGRIQATAFDLSRASLIAGMPLAGSLELVAEARPGDQQPAVAIHLGGRGLTVESVSLDSLAADLTLRPMVPLAQGWQGAELEGTIGLRQASLSGEPLHPVADLDIQLDVGVPAQGAIAIRSLAASSEQLALSARGSFDPQARGGALHLTLETRDLKALVAALGPSSGLELTGRARLAGEVRIEAGFSAVETDLQLATGDLAGLPEPAAILLGGEPTLAGTVRYAPGEPLALRRLQLAGAGAELLGELTYRPDDGALGGRLTASLPRLAVFEAWLGQPLAGAARVQADLGGTLAAPQVRAQLEATPLELAGQAFDRIELAATAAGPIDALSGHLTLTAARQGQQAQLASTWQVTAEMLQLVGLTLDAPATRLTGDVRVRFAGPLIDGRLVGAIQDLAGLEVWLGQKLTGAVRLDAEFVARGGAQDMALQAEVSKLAGSFGGLFQAALKARVEDALGSPRLEATLDAREFTQPGLRVRTASADLSGPLADLLFVATAEGEQQAQPFAFRAEAAIAALDARKRLVLRRLEGTLGERQVLLRKPATAVLEQGVLQIDELDLMVGEGQIRGGLLLDRREVRGFASLDRLPLGMLAAFGGPRVAGEANLELTLAGTTRTPRLTLAGRFVGLRPADDLYGTLPAADLLLRGDVAEGRFALAFEVAKLEGTTARGQLTGPLTLRLKPFELAWDPAGALSGKVDARLALASLAAIAGLDGQKLEGQLSLAVRIAGTAAAPEIAGTAEIRDARLQDSVTGVTLTGLTLRLEAEGERLRLVALRAGDGREGELKAVGELRLGGASGFTYRVQLDLDDFVVVDNALAWAVADARLEASGDAQSGRLKGRIELDRAEFAMPSGGGLAIPELEVIEVGNGAPPWQPDASLLRRSAERRGYELALDVRLDMPARIFVRGRGLQSEWGGSLRFSGSATAPVIEGAIGVRRGYVDLLDRRFVIREGEIRFVGSSPPRPEINLVAAAAGNGLTAIVRLAGAATEPVVTIDSEPTLPTDEILARLLFGRDVSRITPLQGIRLAAAVRQLEGGGGLDVLGSLRETIGIDTLDIGGDSPAEAYVSAGKYVAENVFVEVQQSLATGQTKARVEVELTETINVVTETGNGASGVEVEWRYDY